MNMRKLLIAVVCSGVAGSIALGVRNQLTESAPIEHEVVSPGSVQAPATPATPSAVDPNTPVSNVGPVPTGLVTPPVGGGQDGAASPGVENPRAVTPEKAEAPKADVAGGTAAAQEDGAAVLRRAAAAYRTVKAMSADFRQEQENPILRRRITSRGTFFQQQPDKFLMRFSEPAGDVVVGDGRYFWIYYPSHDAKQVIRLPASVGQGVDLQAQFIGDPTKRFDYTLLGKEQVGGRQASVLMLVPKEAAGYRSLKVWIDDKDSLIRRFVLTNDNGVVQNFELANLQTNPRLDPAIFRFTPPAGATIVER